MKACLFCEYRVDAYAFHYITDSNINLNGYKYVYLLSLFLAKKKEPLLELFEIVCHQGEHNCFSERTSI